MLIHVIVQLILILSILSVLVSVHIYFSLLACWYNKFYSDLGNICHFTSFIAVLALHLLKVEPFLVCENLELGHHICELSLANGLMCS